MNKPTIIITGANGFIGEYLVNSFFRKGWKVKAFVHSVPKNRLEGVEYIEYDLEKSPNANDFTSVDYLVHFKSLSYGLPWSESCLTRFGLVQTSPASH